jgi:hypothetical protein
MAYFAAKAGVYTKPSVEILATIITNFVPSLAILFVTFEYYRNLAPDCQVKKPWLKLDGTMGRIVGRLKKLMPYSRTSSPLAKLRIFSSLASSSSSHCISVKHGRHKLDLSFSSNLPWKRTLSLKYVKRRKLRYKPRGGEASIQALLALSVKARKPAPERLHA